MKTYETYKETCISWIGRIPSTWRVGRPKYNYYLKGRIGWQGLKADEFVDNTPYYLVTGTDFHNGRVDWKTCYHISRERYDEAPEIHVQIGDLLVTKDGTIGKVALIDDKPDYVSLNSHLLIMRPTNLDFNNRFLYWIIQSPVFERYYGETQNGSIMASLSQEKISCFSFPLPTKDEQSSIANYLDRKVSRIDSIIEEARASIEEYKAWKASIIYEAVTKGLDPTVEMKDSGVEWIGTVPKNWSVGNFGRFVSMIQTGPFGSQLHSDDYVEGGIPVINPANIQNGCIVVNEKNCITEEQANTLKQHLMQLHDIVFGRRGEMGRCACVIDTERQYFCGTGCIRIKCNELMNPIFAAHYLQMPKVKQYLELHSVGTTMANLNAGIISGIPILCPPIDEQEDICQLISNQSATIDSLISEKESLITDLEAYKKSLIFEVVTGKRKVV